MDTSKSWGLPLAVQGNALNVRIWFSVHKSCPSKNFFPSWLSLLILACRSSKILLHSLSWAYLTITYRCFPQSWSVHEKLSQMFWFLRLWQLTSWLERTKDSVNSYDWLYKKIGYIELCPTCREISHFKPWSQWCKHCARTYVTRSMVLQWLGSVLMKVTKDNWLNSFVAKIFFINGLPYVFPKLSTSSHNVFDLYSKAFLWSGVAWA